MERENLIEIQETVNEMSEQMRLLIESHLEALDTIDSLVAQLDRPTMSNSRLVDDKVLRLDRHNMRR